MKGANSNFAYSSTLNAFATIIRKEGYIGLYKGMVPNVVKVKNTFSLYSQELIWITFLNYSLLVDTDISTKPYIHLKYHS